MFKHLISALALFLALTTTATAQRYTDDSQLEAFLLSGGITPEAIDMQWYRSCQLYIVSLAGDSDRASAWTFMSERESQRLKTRINLENQTDPTLSRRVTCEVRPAFADAAHPSARIHVQRFSFMVGEQQVTLTEGDTLRYHDCRQVRVLGTTYQKPGC
jgi:hypothetical protein